MVRILTIPSERVVLIVGSGKNAGKTVVLKELMRRAEGLRRGLVTIGNDGEGVDALDGRDKPRVRVAPGDLVCTTADCLVRSTALTAWTDLLPFTVGTATLHVAEVRRAGEIELVGPDTASQLACIVTSLKTRGADTILVDGALDRLSQAAALPGSGVVYVASTRDFPSLEHMRRNLSHLVRITNGTSTYTGRGPGEVPRGTVAVVRNGEVDVLPGHVFPTPERLGNAPCTLYVHRPVTESWLARLGEPAEGLERIALHDPWTLTAAEPFWGWCTRYDVMVEVAHTFRLAAIFVTHAPGPGQFPGPQRVVDHLQEGLGGLFVRNAMLAAEALR